MEARELLQQFNDKYGGYVCIDEEVVEKFVKAVNNEKLFTPDYLYDWVLAGDMAYEVVE